MYHPSVWEKETFFAPRDIIIAGSGLVGLWSAYCLKKRAPNLNILILEKGLIPSGASSRNAGFACIGSATELLAHAREAGEQSMLEIVAMRYEGLRRLQKVFSKKEIGFENFGGYELINKTQYAKARLLKNDLGWLNITLRKAIREDKMFRIADKKIGDFGFDNISHLVQSRGEGQLHSGKLIRQLLQRVQGMGVTILTQTEVTGYQEGKEKLTVQTTAGISFDCQKLLVCTNGFAGQLLPELDVHAVRGQVLVAELLNKTAFKGAFHFDEGFYYFRNLSGNRVLLGGARNKALAEENSDEAITTHTVQQELENFLRTVVLPKQSFTITDRWGGIMGMGGSRFPIIKRVAHNVHCAVRMSGMGVAISPVVGDIVARQLL